MIKKFRKFTLILIIFFALLTCYLALIKPKEIISRVMVDSFGFSLKIHDTLEINYPISEEEFKDILFTVHCFSDEYGGEAFSIDGIETGESYFGRTFKLKDSTLIFGTKETRIGESLEDIQQYRCLWNIFETQRNKLSVVNEGFIKIIKIWEVGDKQSIIKLKKPILFITGNSYDSSYINQSILTFYRFLPYIMIFLGLIYWTLSKIIRIKFKIKHNH